MSDDTGASGGSSDQLAGLGQQVLDSLLAAYNPSHAPDVALAILPGQPIDSDLVGENGMVNETPVSLWLHDEYDQPLWLQMADGTPLPGSFGSGVKASEIYLLSAVYGQPLDPPGSAGFDLVEALIQSARGSLALGASIAGIQDYNLPLGCEPEDFPEAGSAGWQVFDQVVTATSTTTTTTPGSTPVSPRQRIDPRLWQVRAAPQAVVQAMPEREQVMVQRRQLLAAELAAPVIPAASEAPAVEAAPAEPLDLRSQVLVRPMAFASPLLAHRSAPARSDVMASVAKVNPALLQAVSRVQLTDIVAAPAVSTVTTSSDLHVHFEHCLVTVTRRFSGANWWHDEFLSNRGWYLPHYSRGDFVSQPPDRSTAYCLPRALLLVRNISITGTWTADALATFEQPMPWFGPFLLQQTANDQTADNKVTIAGAGTQVIGVLCTRMPTLPPCDDPSIAAGTTPDATTTS